MFCLAPVLLTGYLLTVQTSWHHTTEVNAPMVEVQTCERGLGLHGRIQFAGLYSVGLHYGLQYRTGDWSITFQPRAGLSYTSEARHELPADHQFEVGAQLLLGYDHWRVGIDYWHLSNAGLKSPNIGLDLVGIVAGWSF